MTTRQPGRRRLAALVAAWMALGAVSQAPASEPPAPRLQAAGVTDAEVQRRFASHPHDYDEYRLSHIFIAIQDGPAGSGRTTRRSEAQALARARAIKRKLDAGADFARLAKTRSDDGATAAIGGALSSIFDRYLADEFATAVRQLAVGQVSPPTRGPAGYHLIRLDELHPASFETAKGMIDAELQEEARARSGGQPSQARPLAVDPAAAEPGPAAPLQP